MILLPYSLATDLWRGRLNIASDTIRLIILADTYVPNRATHSRRSSVASHELATGGGYTQGGAVVVPTDATDTATGIHTLTLVGATLGGNSNIGRYACWYKARGGAAADDELIAILDFGASITGPFVIPSQLIKNLIQ